MTTLDLATTTRQAADHYRHLHDDVERITGSRRGASEADDPSAPPLVEVMPRVSIAPWGTEPAASADLVSERVLGEGGMGVVLLLLRCLAGAMANRAGRVLIAMPFMAQGGALVSLWVGSRLGLSPSAPTVFALLVVSATTLAETVASASWPAHAFDIAALACGCACVEVALFFRAFARAEV